MCFLSFDNTIGFIRRIIMAYNEQQAREIIVSAGLKLFELGLVERTWGNISARISDTQFLITPSGKPYDTITPDQIVLANISDWSYEGDIIPSDEIGIHAYIYELRSEVNFIIHTHQQKACILSAAEVCITDVPEQYRAVLGDFVPCSSYYGLPSTKKLCRSVRDSVKRYTNSRAVIMQHHGTVCFGKDHDDAFNIALALEDACKITIENKYMEKSGAKVFDEDELIKYYLSLFGNTLEMPKEICDLGSSTRKETVFKITFKDGSEFDVELGDGKLEQGVPTAAILHREIYNSSPVEYISHLTNPYAVAVSVVAKPMKSYLDDYAQIAGTVINVSEYTESNPNASAKNIVSALKGKNAVLLKNCGALCTARYERDNKAIGIVMSKGCEAEVAVRLFESGRPINAIRRQLMRTFFTMKYAKYADKKN